MKAKEFPELTPPELLTIQGAINELNDTEQEALRAIIIEYKRAIKKHPNFPKHDAIYAGAIVSEEAGELIRACLQYAFEGGNEDEMHKEAIQTGAMALRFLTQE